MWDYRRAENQGNNKNVGQFSFSIKKLSTGLCAVKCVLQADLLYSETVRKSMAKMEWEELEVGKGWIISIHITLRENWLFEKNDF